MKGSMRLLWTASAIVALCACSDKTVDAPEAPQAPQAPLQRLAGSLAISEEYAMIDVKTGQPFVVRKMLLQGKIDQLVRVQSGDDGQLRIETDGNAPLTMSGTIVENGTLTLDSPDAATIVKTRARSDYSGSLGEFTLRIRRSGLGQGDELDVGFDTAMAGAREMKVTMRNGTTIDPGTGGMDAFISLLEEDKTDPAKRVFKRDFALMPALGAVPADGLNKMMYDGLKANPGTGHTGLVTAAGRNAWRYSGSKNYGITGAETRWIETVKLDLKLGKP